MNVYIYNCKLRKNLLERIFSPVSEIFPDRKLWIEPVLAAVLAVAIVFCIEGLDLALKSLSVVFDFSSRDLCWNFVLHFVRWFECIAISKKHVS